MDRIKEEMTLEDIVNYKPVRVNPVKKIRVFLDNGDKRLYNMLKEQIRVSREIQRYVKSEVNTKYKYLFSNTTSLNKYLGIFEPIVCSKYPRIDKKIIRDILRTIYYFGNKLSNIKYWYCKIELLNNELREETAPPIEYFNVIRFKDISKKGDITLPFYYDKALKEPTKLTVKHFGDNCNVSLLEDGILALDLWTISGLLDEVIVYSVPKDNPMYKTLKSVYNLPYIYGNLLLENIRSIPPSKITRAKSYKGLYKRLHQLLSKDKTLNKTELKTVDYVADTVYEWICENEKIPTVYYHNEMVPIHIEEVLYGRIVTDMGVIDNIDTYMETYNYLDFSKTKITPDRESMILLTPIKGGELYT